MIDRRAALALAGIAAARPQAALAQASSTDPEEQRVMEEVIRFRIALRRAAAAKDKAALDGMYAARFAHWRDTGKYQLKELRIDDIVAGVPSIETAPEQDLSIVVFGTAAAVVTGSSAIKIGTGPEVDFAWMQVLVKLGGAWQVAASQSARLAPQR